MNECVNGAKKVEHHKKRGEQSSGQFARLNSLCPTQYLCNAISTAQVALIAVDAIVITPHPRFGPASGFPTYPIPIRDWNLHQD